MSAAANSNANDIPGLDFTPWKPGDSISDELMAEFARRMRFASSPIPAGSDGVTVGFGAINVSDSSGNQIITQGNGIYVGLGAGLGVFQSQGLFLNPDNQVALRGHRVFRQMTNSLADGEFTFSLPEQLDNYGVAVTPYGDPGTAKWWVSDKNSTVVKVTVDDHSVNFGLEITVIELL